MADVAFFPDDTHDVDREVFERRAAIGDACVGEHLKWWRKWQERQMKIGERMGPPRGGLKEWLTHS